MTSVNNANGRGTEGSGGGGGGVGKKAVHVKVRLGYTLPFTILLLLIVDRKSTRLNSSH